MGAELDLDGIGETGAPNQRQALPDFPPARHQTVLSGTSGPSGGSRDRSGLPNQTPVVAPLPGGHPRVRGEDELTLAPVREPVCASSSAEVLLHRGRRRSPAIDRSGCYM